LPLQHIMEPGKVIGLRTYRLRAFKEGQRDKVQVI